MFHVEHSDFVKIVDGGSRLFHVEHRRSGTSKKMWAAEVFHVEHRMGMVTGQRTFHVEHYWAISHVEHSLACVADPK